MKFIKLTIENYKSFQFPTEISFPMAENGHSIFLIGGMNGAGKTSIMEALNYCLYGTKVDEIYRSINRREKAKGNANVVFELVMEMDDGTELIINRSWSAGTVMEPKPRDLTERLVVVRDGKRASLQNKEIWQDFIRSAIPPGITQFFFWFIRLKRTFDKMKGHGVHRVFTPMKTKRMNRHVHEFLVPCVRAAWL